MLCPACGSKMNEDDRKCITCGTLLIHGPKVRGESTYNTPSGNKLFKDTTDERSASGQTFSKEAAAKQAAAEAAVKKAAEEAAARRAAEEAEKKAAAKRAAEEAAAKKVAEEAAAKRAAEAAAKRAAEEADAKRVAEEVEKKAAAKRAAEEAEKKAAAKRAAEEAEKKAAAIRAAEEAEKKAAAIRAAEEAEKRAAAKRTAEAAAKRAEEEAAARRAAEEDEKKASAREAAEESAAKKAAEEAAAIEAAIEIAIKDAEEAAAKRAAEEVDTKKATEEAAAKRAAEEADAKKAAEEAVLRKEAEKAETKLVSSAQRLIYKIIGGNHPSASITLDEGQSIFTQSDAMVWMSQGIAIETKKKHGGSPFIAIYTSSNYGQEIGIASRFPGEIQVLNIGGGSVIVQKEAFLAAQPSVMLSAHVSMNLGGEHDDSIVFQRLSGNGMAFIAITGSLIERVLSPGEIIKADTVNIAAFEEGVSFQTQIISNFQNTVFGEGLFLSTLTGPGKVWLQTLSAHV